MIQKFSQIKISAPMKKSDLENTLKELKVMKQAFVERGDIEREENKQKFLREQKQNRGGDDRRERGKKYHKNDDQEEEKGG